MSEPSSSDVLRFVEAAEKWRALSAERVRIRNAIATAVEERDRIAYQAHIKFLGDGSDYVAGFRAGQRYAAATWRALDRIACGKLIDICLGEYGRVEDQDADINDCLRELFSVREPDEPTPPSRGLTFRQWLAMARMVEESGRTPRTSDDGVGNELALEAAQQLTARYHEMIASEVAP